MKVYDALYLDILIIGRANVETGLSYTILRKQLEKKGYDFNNEYVDTAVKVWYYDSFHHAEASHGNIEFEDLDNHLNCNFVMKGDACLKLLSHKKSELNNKLTLYSVVLAGIALVSSVIAIIVSLIYY